MNSEHLIHLLALSRINTVCLRSYYGGESETYRELTHHIRDIDSTVNSLSSLAIEKKEVQGSGVSDKDELCHLLHVLQDIQVELVRATEVFRSASSVATKRDLEKLGEIIMSAIGDWAVKVGPKLDRVQAGLDVVQGLVEQLQNTSGAITAEDQALLDQIEAKVDAIATDADSVPAPPPVTPGA